MDVISLWYTCVYFLCVGHIRRSGRESMEECGDDIGDSGDKRGVDVLDHNEHYDCFLIYGL
jgi:hypothetical protein